MEYKEIKIHAGENIDQVIGKLSEFKKRGELAYCDFNKIRLYSDIDDINSAYIKITGMTKSKFDKTVIDEIDKDKKEKEQHVKSIPKLTKKWIKKGKGILDKEYHLKWEECVPIRLNDLYRGLELEATLDIVKELNAGCKFSIAKNIIDNQGHSGASYGLVRSMIRAFCKRGDEFVSYLKEKELKNEI